MSRKSRQKKGRKLLRNVLPVWLAAVMLIGGLWLGLLGLASPFLRPAVSLEDTVAVSATVQQIHVEYGYHRKHRKVDSLFIDFEDHERLYIPNPACTDLTAEKVSAYPAGTVFDMRILPGNRDILALSVTGEDVLTFESMQKVLAFDNALGILLGVIMLVIAAYAAWSLITSWRYRRLQ